MDVVRRIVVREERRVEMGRRHGCRHDWYVDLRNKDMVRRTHMNLPFSTSTGVHYYFERKAEEIKA